MIIANSKEARARAAAHVAAGDIIAFRTDTLYGLGVDPFNRAALDSLRALKGREDNKPVLVVVSDAAAAGRFVANRSKLFETLSTKLWPGAITLVVNARPEVPAELTAHTGTIGVRLPADENVRALVRACGGALTATSANRAGQLPARDAAEVAAAFPTGLALIIGDGPATSVEPSTVVDVSGAEPRLIRAGVVSWVEIERALTV